MDVVDDGFEVQQQYQTEDDQHELRDQVGERERQVEDARFLDADNVQDDEAADQEDSGEDVPLVLALNRVDEGYVLAEDAEVADREVSRDGHRRRVVQELHPADQEPDRAVERTPRKARATTCVRKRCCSLGVVESCGHEDGAREDESERGQPQCERRRDAERVVNARSDVAVAGREKRWRAKGARQLGGAADDDP